MLFGDCYGSMSMSCYDVELFSIIFIVYAMHSCLISQYCLPETWKYAIVTPVHKKGPTSDPNNFRPISLTATCCRVMDASSTISYCVIY